MSEISKQIKQDLNEAMESTQDQLDEITEYDFTNGIRGKHYKAMQQGYTVRIYQTDGTILVKQCRLENGVEIVESTTHIT